MPGRKGPFYRAESYSVEDMRIGSDVFVVVKINETILGERPIKGQNGEDESNALPERPSAWVNSELSDQLTLLTVLRILLPPLSNVMISLFSVTPAGDRITFPNGSFVML